MPIASVRPTATHAPSTPVLRVETSPGRALGSFRPVRALGGAIDRLPPGSVDTLYSPAVMQPVLSAGWGAVTYRLNTELHVEAWHWNPKGTWSDATGRGYFMGAVASDEPIRHSFGYPLPLRGYTRNEGTENEGYSRLTDGDSKSYWKSNPYLSHPFTGEDDDRFPQWIVIDLGRPQDVNAIRIAWGAPFAKTYGIQYWTGQDAIKKPAAGRWMDFPSGFVDKANGGTVTHKLAPSPMAARFVRVVMMRSSQTCNPRGKSDPRNCVGYAIYEVSLGTQSKAGDFHDLVQHTPSQAQTTTYCSSVDPWHEPADLDPRRRDQTGLDLFFTSGVTRGLPAMIPVAILYGTPEDAAAEITYVQKKGYPISHIELGEEPDGQYMTPEHYAALYLQWATALHRVDPTLKLGGPAFTGVNQDIESWPDARGKTSWWTRFLDYLKEHGRLDDLAFMSFEHYPYEPCKIQWEDLYDEPGLINHIVHVWREDGLPANVPMYITEENMSWQANETFVGVFGGLWLADHAGAFLSAGGAGTFYFHYFPGPLRQACDDTWGAFTMFNVDRARTIKQPVSQYFAAQLVTQDWVQPGDEPHRLFPVSSEIIDDAGHVLVTAYAVQRPGGQWALLVINKHPIEAIAVRVVFHNADSPGELSFSGEVSVATFGADNYVWHPKGADGYADPDGPVVRRKEPGSPDAVYTLPKASVTVLRGSIL